MENDISMSEQSFRTCVMLKSAREEDGQWYVSGPVASTNEDYDGEILEKAGVLKGLQMFWNLGRHVDWEHQYGRTHDPDYVIGKGIKVSTIDGVPWLTTMLYKAKPYAKKLWDHLQSGGDAGYSIEGIVKARHPKNHKHVLETEIHRVTISLSPKGYDARIQPGDVAVGLEPVLKAIEALEGTAEKSIVHGKKLTKTEAHYRPDVRDWRCSKCHYYDDRHCNRVNGAINPNGVCDYYEKPSEQKPKSEKALTTGSGVVQSGDTGGTALRRQHLRRPLARARNCRCSDSGKDEACKMRRKKPIIRKAIDTDDQRKSLSGPTGLSGSLPAPSALPKPQSLPKPRGISAPQGLPTPKKLPSPSKLLGIGAKIPSKRKMSKTGVTSNKLDVGKEYSEGPHISKAYTSHISHQYIARRFQPGRFKMMYSRFVRRGIPAKIAKRILGRLGITKVRRHFRPVINGAIYLG